MNNGALELKIGDSHILCVPAVHFRVAFAEHVNEICRDFRPEAVAVELGPETASAASAWMKDLGVGPASRRRLPCMLGLLKENRRIHPARRELAARLQQLTGRDLRQLPPELLKEQLGYSGVRVLYLSPTDSIIEAVRCAAELEVPLYGVDLEETAERITRDSKVQDPTMAWENVAHYVANNEPFAAAQRDEVIDTRRELAMAARLKGLLAKHKRIVFSCGLAHWPDLKRLLTDADVRPADFPDVAAADLRAFRRVVVHPLLAIYHMDVFPAFAQGYEEGRVPASQRRAFRHSHSPSTMFSEMLQGAYLAHFAGVDASQMDRRQEDFATRLDMERLLANLCNVKQLQVPDLFTALTVAKTMMSESFRDTLAQVLMEFPWATEDDWPDLQVLAPSPSPSSAKDYIRAELTRRDGQRGRYFYIDPLPGRNGGSYRVAVPIPSNWTESQRVKRGGSWRSWNPRDCLKTAMSARAIELANAQERETRVDAFEGALMDGIDIKSTLRSHTRGEDRVFVRNAKPRRLNKTSETADGFPVVWILRPEADEGCELTLSGDWLTNLQPAVQNRQRLQEIEDSGARFVLLAVDYSKKAPDDRIRLNGNPVDRRLLMGILLFQPPHFEYEQSAAWLEQTDFRRSPMLKDFEMPTVAQHYQREHGIDPANYDWHTALLLMGIPYARDTMTVVAPDRYSLPRVVADQAIKHGVRINQTPLSYFPREELEKMATDYFVPSLGQTGNDYPVEVERLLGEKQTAYENLVPKRWRSLGKRKARAD